MSGIESWVRAQYRARYCDENGKQCVVFIRGPFCTQLKKEQPGQAKAIKSAVKLLDDELYQADIDPEVYSRAVEWAERGPAANFPMRKNGKFVDRGAAASVLGALGIYLHPKHVEKIVNEILIPEAAGTTLVQSSAVQTAVSSASTSNRMSNRQLQLWIYQQYIAQASQPGFKDAGFVKSLIQLQPDKKKKIFQLVAVCRQPGHKYSFPELNTFSEARAVEPQNNHKLAPESSSASEADTELGVMLQQLQLTSSSQSASKGKQPAFLQNEPIGVSTRENSTLPMFTESSSSRSPVSDISSSSFEHIITPVTEIDYTHINLLQADAMATEAERNLVCTNEDIKHAPLMSADIIDSTEDNFLPQVGFLGAHVDNPSSPHKALFLNTNVPFSAVVCGVQGSGKSHTVSCLLENALIPSRHLGRLKMPLSALVFHYGKFGSTFRVSESAYLTAPHPAFPTHPTVKRITVLVSPSNPAIARLYSSIPNVRVLPFKLKAQSLNIDTMLTLMAVDESASPPLYLASVTKILRQMAMEGSGEFNYLNFKARLKLCQFNRDQLNMLELRLDLLESFLDMTNSCQQPDFLPGEITIMDMSCPFVDANMACVLFGIGLQNYLQSRASGKMVVLDEAHKYMLNVPGAKALNEDLTRIIRLQRHYGARVVISTQEPILLTDLIALCSVTVVHRFSSPEWFNALKKHIPMLGQDKDNLLQEIEALRTGVALVYSPNAVLGKNEEGGLVRGTSRLLKVSVRKRVTADGGQSVLSVN